MPSLKHTGCLLLLLAMHALPSLAAVLGSSPYAVKPAWWDSVVVRSPPGAQMANPDAAWKSLSAADKAQPKTVSPEKVEIRCRSMVVQHFPDDATVIGTHGSELATLYARLGDVPNFKFWVSHVLAVQKDPLHVATAASAWDTVVSRRADLAQALNAVLRDYFIAARNIPSVRDVLGEALLKNMPVDDMEPSIRAFKSAGYMPPPQRAAQLLTLCVHSNASTTVPYWIENYVLRAADLRQAAEVLRPLLATAGDAVCPALYDGVENALLQRPENCAPLIRLYAETALAHGDSERLDRLLDMKDGMVRGILPFEAAQWDLEVARAELDPDRARAALAAAIQIKPAYTNAPEYERARAEVFKMRAGGGTRPSAILNDPDDVVQTIARFTRQNEPSRLHGYIRRMLVERGHLVVVDPSDNNLFTSAKAFYRNVFTNDIVTYAPYLSREVEELAARPGMAAEAGRLQRCAALTPPASAQAPLPMPLRAAAQVAAPQGVFGGLLELPAGTGEACGEDTRMTCLNAWQPVLSGSGTDLNGLQVVQNSRGVAALANGVLKWSYVAALNPAAFSKTLKGYGGLCRPARAGGIVAVRLETSGARFELIGFDAHSGVIRWRWCGANAAEEPAGSPAVWKGAFFLLPVLRTGVEESELSLVVLAADTGCEAFRIPLTAAARASIVSRACGAALCHQRTLAAPAVAGDSAYVDTGLGLVCALDLQDECVRWARLYQRKFDDVGGGMRVPVSPVAGSRNVLFAPVDSHWLLLVDRATGALVQRRTDLAWTSVGPCGPENALVTTPGSIQRLSLAGAESGALVSKPHMLHVAALADGCVLSGNGELAIVDTQGRILRSMKVPAAVVPAGMDDEGRWWGWGGVDAETWGRLDDNSERKSFRLSEATSGAGPTASPSKSINPDLPVWLPATAGAFRMHQNLLTRMNVDGHSRWEIPLPSDCTVLEAGKHVLVNCRRRVWSFDDTDGRVCSVWPLLSGLDNGDTSVIRITTRGAAVYAVAASPTASGKTRIWDLGVDGQSTAFPLVDLPIGTGALADFWVTTTATQVFVITRAPKDADVRLFRANRPEKPHTAPVAEAVVEAQWSGAGKATVWHDRGRRNAVILSRNPGEIVRFNADGIQRHVNDALTDLGPGNTVGWGGLVAFHDTKASIVRLLEPLNGGSVVLFDRPVDKTDRPLWKNSGCIGTEIFGLQALKAGQVLLYRQDLARATEKNDAAQKALLNGAGPGLDEAWRGVVSLGDGRVMLMTSCKMNKRDDLMRGFIWTPGARDFNTVILPGAMQSVQPLSENLWSVGEDLFTAADWAHAAALDKQIRTLKCRSITNESFAVDGFLDEWKDEEFVAIPQGRLAIRRPAIGSSFFRMAVDLTNQTAAAAVAASSDLRSACRVWVGRGEAASFEVQRAQVPLLANEAVIGPPAPTVRCCAWQVTPDARHVTMEFEFCPLGMTLRKPGVAPTEQSLRLGDLAIRITLDDPLIGSVDLVGNSHLAALGFVRLLLL